MKAAKQITCFLIAAAMIFTGMPSYAFEKPANAVESLQNGYSDDENAYAIYPIPQNISYGDGSFTLASSVKVVCEDNIDAYTTDFLDEILENYGRTKTSSGEIAGSGSQILLGVKGSGGAVDNWVTSHLTLAKTDLFEQTDSYLLSADNGTIVILGKDTDAAFYGLATLQMMFSSFNGTKFLNAQIEDYAGMKMRGFIEGMYGGWSYEGRASLMRFGRDVKMNTYIYASKNDTYHTNKWDVLYPDDQIEQIEKLVAVGNETKVIYGWSVHAAHFFSSLPSMSDANYNSKFNENYDKLIAKFQQLYDIGVRKFAILNDDFGGGSLSEVVRLLNKIDNEFLTPKGCKNLTYCMQGYNRGWANGGYGQHGAEMKAMKGLNPSIDLFWTGDDVNSPITQDTVNYVKEKTNHEAVYWLNYPVNEHSKAGLYLGEISHYIRDDVTGLAGAMSNPSEFAEANKVGLFQLAAAFWNNHNYLAQAVTIWENAFKYLQPEVYESYLTLARNIANCPGSGRVLEGFPESEYIKDELESVSEKIQSGESIANDENAQTLIDEFSNMLEAIETFRSDCANEELIKDMDCWLKSLKDVATAGKAVIESVIAMENGELDEAWAGVGAAGAAMDTWNTYTSKQSTNVQAGSKRLVPFIQKILPIAKNQILPLLNPSVVLPVSHIAVIHGMDRTDTAELAKAFDGDETTLARYQEGQQQAGDYFGIDLGKATSIKTVKIISGGANDEGQPDPNGANFFHNAILEYSMTGKNNDWHTIQEYTDDSAPRIIEVDCANDNLTARFVRLRLTKKGTPGKPDYWTHIWEFSVNGGQTEEPEEPAYGLFASEGVDAEVTLEQLTYNIKNTAVTLPADGYIGIKLQELSRLQSASWQASGNPNLTFQYSANGIVWTEMPTDPSGAMARYVRLYNGTGQEISATLNSLSVTTATSAVKLSLYSNSPELNTANNATDNKTDYMFDGDRTTRMWFASAQLGGHELIFDLGSTVPVYDLAIVQDKTPNENPKLYYAQIALSADGSNWDDPIITINNAQSDHRAEEDGFIIFKRNDLDGITARYMRILITQDAPNAVKLRINEIEVNKTVQSSDEPVRKIETNLTGNVDKMIDGDISTVYASETPSDGNAYIKYSLTENTNLTSVTLMQNANEITNAKVTAEIWNGSSIETKELGTLSAGSTIFYFDGIKDVLSLTVTWPEGTTPTLYEIMPIIGEKMHTISFNGEDSPEDLICSENRFARLPESTPKKPGYIFKGWSDGTATYAAGKLYKMGTSDVTLTSIWEEDPTQAASVSVSQKNANLTVDDTLTLSASVAPDTAINKDVTWTSDHTDIATVDPDTGKVTAIAAGIAVITATAKSGAYDSCTVTVAPPVSSVSITPKSAILAVGDTQTLNASVLPTDAINKDVIWASDNINVATVDSVTGEVTAVTIGTAIITATANNGKSDSCTVTVTTVSMKETTEAVHKALKDFQELPPSSFAPNSYTYTALKTLVDDINKNMDKYSEKELRAKLQELETKKSNLATAATYNSLKNKLDKYGNLKPADYTPDSWKDLNSLITQIKKNLDTYSESELQAQITKLESAKKALVTAQKNPPKDETPKDETTFKNVQYKILNAKAKTATALKLAKANATAVTIQATVKIGKDSYKVTEIAPNFAKASKLKSVVIGKNVKAIGQKAFNGCKKLNKVTFKGASVKKIGSKAFKNTNSKITVKVPNKVKKAAFKKKLTKAGMSKRLKL